MPEGPEVRVIVDMMNFYMSGKVLWGMDFLSGHNKKEEPENYSDFIGALPLRVDNVFCKGKLIVIAFSKPGSKPGSKRGKWWILNHLVMTGSWRLDRTECEESHIRGEMHFDETPLHGSLDITSIYFTDVRDLGKFDFIYDHEEFYSKLSSLAPGFIGDYIIDYETFHSNIVKAKKSSLISKLRDQKSICSGIGNYLLSEIMYDAELSHLLRCDELSDKRIKRLYESCKSIITLSYRMGGLSIANYVDINGDKGGFGPLLKVYRKDGKEGRGSTDPHGNKVSSIKKGQTFWYVHGLQRREEIEEEE
jgi:formamidopyrimidine-DNA glycosylase